MAVLKNARHEKFAQGMFSGLAKQRAYLAAYPGSTEAAAASSATALLKNPKVSARIDELQRKVEARALITREMVINGLLGLAQGGEDVPASVKRAAWRDLGEHLAMFKVVVDHRYVAELAEKLGLDPAEVQAEAEAILRGAR